MNVWPGKPYPLGANWDGQGVSFALFSEHASGVELCLFDEDDNETRIQVTECDDYVWHAYIPTLQPGQLYAYRVHGEFQPTEGHRFNPSKLLIDPYAKAINGDIKWNDAMFSYPINSGELDRDLEPDNQDSVAGIPRSVVCDPSFDWTGDVKPSTPLHASIIYETHVKGFTINHPKIDPKLRGTYAGLSTPEAISYLQKLGITAVELLPVHHFVNDKTLFDKGLNNYWGYNTIGFFAPHAAYASTNRAGEQVREFKSMVKALHAAGIEVILDVVYNHTAEGNHYGPTLSFKGIDNLAYYRLVRNNFRYYMDYTGTGNTLNMIHSYTLQLVMDSLRYWVTEMHVDGFRFDLAATLARGLHEVSRLSSFLDIIHQDPIISQVKLIAEPWDVGEGGYQVGNFPVLWAEWNGKYRDLSRRLWGGERTLISELAYRLSGSSDLYKHNGRRPSASINFVTAHDGFTLNDLVSYNEKHNLANGENNNDGERHNNSWNCGIEGVTDDPKILSLRERQKRNLLATLLFSQGVPMLCGGDEYGRTQGGNNNAYCQDNEVSWFDWDWTEANQKLWEFTRKLIAIRHNYPVLRRRKFFLDRRIVGQDISDIRWLQPSGKDIPEKQWTSFLLTPIGMLLNGQQMDEIDEKGQPIRDDVLLLLINPQSRSTLFKLPDEITAPHWKVLIDTDQPEQEEKLKIAGGEKFSLKARSLVLLYQPIKATESPI